MNGYTIDYGFLCLAALLLILAIFMYGVHLSLSNEEDKNDKTNYRQ